MTLPWEKAVGSLTRNLPSIECPDHYLPAEPTVSKEKQADIPFEEALAQLETLVERMESGELSLEESLASFEQGIALTRNCQQALDEAEQKVSILTTNTGDAGTEAFDDDA